MLLPMQIRSNVRLAGLCPQLVLGLIVVERLSYNEGLDFVISSVTDGLHSWKSLHYVGHAVDIVFDQPVGPSFLMALKKSLGSEYDVVNESSHVHIEYQPKRSPSETNTGAT